MSSHPGQHLPDTRQTPAVCHVSSAQLSLACFGRPPGLVPTRVSARRVFLGTGTRVGYTQQDNTLPQEPSSVRTHEQTTIEGGRKRRQTSSLTSWALPARLFLVALWKENMWCVFSGQGWSRGRRWRGFFPVYLEVSKKSKCVCSVFISQLPKYNNMDLIISKRL